MNIVEWLPFIGSIIVVIFGYFATRGKNKADAAESISKAAQVLIDPLLDRIRILEGLVAKQQKELVNLRLLPNVVETQKKLLATLRPLPKMIAELTRGVNILISQLKKNNIEPEWTTKMLPALKKA